MFYCFIYPIFPTFFIGVSLLHGLLTDHLMLLGCNYAHFYIIYLDFCKLSITIYMFFIFIFIITIYMFDSLLLK